jgi:hypothetical protein
VARVLWLEAGFGQSIPSIFVIQPLLKVRSSDKKRYISIELD